MYTIDIVFFFLQISFFLSWFSWMMAFLMSNIDDFDINGMSWKFMRMKYFVFAFHCKHFSGLSILYDSLKDPLANFFGAPVISSDCGCLFGDPSISPYVIHEIKSWDEKKSFSYFMDWEVSNLWTVRERLNSVSLQSGLQTVCKQGYFHMLYRRDIRRERNFLS